MNLRQPIVTVVGHVDHGKTSVLDAIRGSCVQEGEAGGITQKISFTKCPKAQIKNACPLIDQTGMKLDIPGFLFIDTPGHAAFTNLRKRGGSLADLAVLVVSIKDGIKPQTAEVLQILKAHKTPFVIALNKVDHLSGWRQSNSPKESIEKQSVNVKQEFDEALLTFQGALQEHGFESDLYCEVKDFTKRIAIVPCSAKTKEGIPELMAMLCGLSQKFLTSRLETSETAKGVILELKKEKSMEWAEAIIYDGQLNEGDELVIASFGEPVVTKVRSLSEIQPLSTKYVPVKSVDAATGVKIQLTNKEGIQSGMPFQEVDEDLENVKKQFKKDMAGAIELDKKGIIVKADSLGSLEALLTLLKQASVKVLKAGIGPISKSDLISAKANLSLDPLDATIVGFNVSLDEDLEIPNTIKTFTDPVVYKLIDDLTLWRQKRQEEILKETMLGLATIAKLEILHKQVFRNSNPAIFGVRIVTGKAKTGIPFIMDSGENLARLKSLQLEKESVNEATEGQECAAAFPGTTFDRKLKDIKYLYADLSEAQYKQFKKHKELLSSAELKVLEEIAQLKRKTREEWGL